MAPHPEPPRPEGETDSRCRRFAWCNGVVDTTANTGIAPVTCEDRTGLARRVCQVIRGLLALAGRGGSAGVPF